MVDNNDEGGLCESLENLNLLAQDEDASNSSSRQQQHGDTYNSLASHKSSPLQNKNPNLILCDAWYGFPTQKRPRKERICAVGRQLVNFLQWRCELNLDALHECKVHLLGKELDVNAVQDRILEIASEEFTTEKFSSKIDFKPNVDIHESLLNWRNDNTDGEVVYLSPDASETLPSTSRPPSIVIVGMLIDRRITSDRSRKRAEESLNLRAMKLPLDVLNVKEMSSDEPLNVDTVMELMQRWWVNCDKIDEEISMNAENANDADGRTSKYKKCFMEAAAWAMKSHRQRHPNRTIHKG
eukprot:scaffold21566_cov73-Cyclotella_meneghiniana.AAC.15